jgi:uncharacterized phage-associated protein
MDKTTKSLSVAKYIFNAVKDKHVTPMQLIKLVYIANGYMLGLYGKTLYDESVQAWRYGPVIPSVYKAVRSFGSNKIEDLDDVADGEFDSDETHVMDMVADVYGQYDGLTLSSATHMPNTPWSITWEQSKANAHISDDLIENFYKGILQQGSHSSI